VDGPVEEMVRRELPDDLADRRAEPDFVALLPEYPMAFELVFTLPSNEVLEGYGELTKHDKKVLGKVRRYLDKRCSGSRLLGWPDTLQGEIVRDDKDIVLLQLNGWELSPNGIEQVFEHWCMDGLIHLLIRRKALRARRWGRVRAQMAYT